MPLRIVPPAPGRRPTDEDTRPGLGASDGVALVTGGGRDNRAVLLVETADLPPDAELRTTITVGGDVVPSWDRRPVPLNPSGGRSRVEVRPDTDLSGVDLSLAAGLLRRAEVRVEATRGDTVLAHDELSLDLCDLRLLGSLYQRVVDRVLVPDTARQAEAAGVPDPGVAYHPWFPVLRIGGEKAALYTAALVADIIGKEYHLTDPAWLLRVGVHLELLTCLGIVEAVRDDVGDLLTPEERDAFDHGPVFAEARARVDPAAWREVWNMRRIAFPGFATPRTGPVSALHLLRKRDVTLRFLHVHHDDLKHAIDLAGPNLFNSQETWQRVFRDAERAVLRRAAEAFPELGFLPGPARELVLWQRTGVAGQQGLYPTAVSQYRSSMNTVADWAKARGLMDHAGPECVPLSASVLEAHMREPARVAVLQRQDGLGPDLTVTEPAVVETPTTEEVEALLSAVPVFRMLGAEDIRSLAGTARPLLLGPTQRFAVQGQEGTSLFLVADGQVEVRLRDAGGGDRLVETMGRGAVVGEMALLTGEPRSATVRAVEEAVVLEIGRQQYQPLLAAHPEWVDELARVMAERLARREAGDGAAVDERRSLAARIRGSLFG